MFCFKKLTLLSTLFFAFSSSAFEYGRWGFGSDLHIGATKFATTTDGRIGLGTSIDFSFSQYVGIGARLYYRALGPRNLKEFGPSAFVRVWPLSKDRLGLFFDASVGWAVYKIDWKDSLIIPEYSSTADASFFGVTAGWLFRIGDGNYSIGPSITYERHQRANFKEKLGGNTVFVDNHNTFVGAFNSYLEF